MTKLREAILHYVDIPPRTDRQDSIQKFISQETIILELIDVDGGRGIGYTYTIGTGGSAILCLLKDHLLRGLRNSDTRYIESIAHDLALSTHATMVGPLTSLALAAIDTALWDLKAIRSEMPLHMLAGGARDMAQAYTTETGWLNLSSDQLVKGALQARDAGMGGVKIKVGKPTLAEDFARLSAVREAVGDSFAIMIDCNQAFCFDEALRRARAFESLGLAWIEEPLPATDLGGHAALASQIGIPVAVGESLYHIGQFGQYLRAGACSIVQVDVARVGGITPWLKVAHAAESLNLAVAPHFLMELHLQLVCACPNARWVEYIPQLDLLCHSGPVLSDGLLKPSCSAGLGIDWDWSAIRAQESHQSWAIDLETLRVEAAS